MQYPRIIRAIVVCLAALFLGLTLAACSSASPTAPTGDPVQDAKNYLLSSERSGRFESIVPAAGAKLAFSLEAGLLGSPAKKLDFNKKPIQPGYNGRGSISTADGSVSVILSWKDGVIDYDSIDVVTVRHANGNAGTSVSIYTPTTSMDDSGNYWLLAKADVEGARVSDYYGIEDPAINQDASRSGMIFPTSLDELKQLDTDGLAQLDGNMNSIFGPRWRN